MVRRVLQAASLLPGVVDEKRNSVQRPAAVGRDRRTRRHAGDWRPPPNRTSSSSNRSKANGSDPAKSSPASTRAPNSSAISPARRRTDTVGMKLDGGCRVGVFTQKMTATIEQERQGLQRHLPGRRRRQGPRHRLRQRRQRPQGGVRPQPQAAARAPCRPASPTTIR